MSWFQESCKGRTVQGRAAVELHLSSALTARNHSLDSFFHADSLKVSKNKSTETSEGEAESKPGVFCSDLKSLVSHLLQYREIDPKKTDIHV